MVAHWGERWWLTGGWGGLLGEEMVVHWGGDGGSLGGEIVAYWGERWWFIEGERERQKLWLMVDERWWGRWGLLKEKLWLIVG